MKFALPRGLAVAGHINHPSESYFLGVAMQRVMKNVRSQNQLPNVTIVLKIWPTAAQPLKTVVPPLTKKREKKKSCISASSRICHLFYRFCLSCLHMRLCNFSSLLFSDLITKSCTITAYKNIPHKCCSHCYVRFTGVPVTAQPICLSPCSQPAQLASIITCNDSTSGLSHFQLEC